MARITRALSALQIDKQDLAILNRELADTLTQITELERRREIVVPAGEVVKEEARNIVKVSTKEHYRYKTPKLSGRLRAPNGQGIRVARYVSGNLKNSIIDIADRKKNLRTGRVIIGPFYRSWKSLLKSGVYGENERTADGYYAHMAYKSAINFRNQVTLQALRNKRAEVVNIIRTGVVRYFVDKARQNKFLG